MSKAVEGAEAVLYGVSKGYKESANCRLEADYAHQQGVDLIPLMMQNGYKANGWLGLLLGTRLWFDFHDAYEDDDEAFEKRMDGLCREIGDRGKLRLPESEVVPPFHEPTLAPAPAPMRASPPTVAAAAAAPAGTPRPPTMSERALAATTSAQRSLGASMQRSPAGVLEHQRLQLDGGGGGQAELNLLAGFAALLREERLIMEAKMQAREDRLRQELESARPQAAAEAISTEQLEVLQTRLQAMHTAKLLTEGELGRLEDTIADAIEVLPTADVKDHAVERTLRMVLLSESMQSDGSLARQLRRKFC